MPNCKVGDNCIIRITKGLLPIDIYKLQPFEGKVVTIVADLTSFIPDAPSKTLWVVSPTMFGREGEPMDVFHDKVLFPLLNTDGEDEMLKKVGKPPQERKIDNVYRSKEFVRD